MLKSDYQQTVAEFKEELALMEIEAKGVSTRVETLARDAESLKIELLQHLLEVTIRSEARHRGMQSLIKDKKRLRNSLLISVGGFVIGGVLTKDKFAALDTGLSSFDCILQGVGNAKWAVLLGNKLAVAPSEQTTSEGEWVTWESTPITLCGKY